MKFDCIVSNAPYDNGLHEKFESKYFELCKGEIVWVSPLSFLLGKKQNKRITLELDKYKTDIEQINGNEYFDAAIGGTMGIVFCDMNKDEYNEHYVKFDGKDYNKCEEITSYSNDTLLVSIKNKIGCEHLKNNLDSHVYRISNDELGFNTHLVNTSPNYVVKISCIRGNKNKPDFYTVVSNDNKEFIKNVGNASDINNLKYFINCDTLEEAKNCFNYLSTDFVMICLYFIKTNFHLDRGELKYVPWQDFTQEWNDEKLFKKYGITKEEIQHIYDILPNYYNIKRIDLDTYEL